MGSLKTLIAAAALAVSLTARADDPALPHLVSKGGHFALMVDGAPYLMLAGQANNSSNYPAELSKVWPALEKMQANTLAMPVAWEQIEPVEGKFDFSFLDVLLKEAREHKIRLDILWFGTWKNNSPQYTPDWVKLDSVRFPRLRNSRGEPVYSMSPYGEATLEADRKAFVALMTHLKLADPQHTVIMVQVENEAGTYASLRDYGPAAEAAFNGPVPDALVKALGRKPGTWRQVFGEDADETFHAWSVASYIERVAAAGKAVYPLPMYANAALKDPFHKQAPGTFESGGPTHNVIAVWKVAAPSLDLVGPDIYDPKFPDYMAYLDLYQRPDNALFVAETGNAADYARYFFAALGHQAIGFDPFGMDYTKYVNYPLGAPKLDPEDVEPFTADYALVAPFMRELAKWSFEGKVHGVSEPVAEHSQTVDLGGKWKATVSYGLGQFGPTSMKAPPGNEKPSGGVFFVTLGPGEFLIGGYHARVEFNGELIHAEEGHFEQGKWVFDRMWNGDQVDYGLNFTSLPQLLKVRLK